MRTRCIVAVATLGMAVACGQQGPTTPFTTTPLSTNALALSCAQSTILAGESVVCHATSGSANLATFATWASSNPSIAIHKGFGIFVGKDDGQVTITATYSGQTVSTPLTVQLQDVIAATASSDQIGATTAMMQLDGFYGVASADSGTLTLLITNQDGATISTKDLTVPHGGDQYSLSSTFTVPAGTTRLCRTGVLQIGSTTLTVVPDARLAPCVQVR